MANTTFSGPVRSENGFEQVTKNATTGAFTVGTSYSNIITGSIAVSYTHLTLPTKRRV